MTDFSKGDGSNTGDGRTGSDERAERVETWDCADAAEIEIAVDLGRVRVDLVETPAAGTGQVRVEVRHDPSAAGGFARGVSGFVNWVSSASGFQGQSWEGGSPFDPTSWGEGSWDGGRFAADAVRAAEISWSETGRRLVVRSSTEMPLRLVPLAVTVSAPSGSRVAVRTGAGDVTTTGRAGWAALRTGSGAVQAATVAGDLDVHTGSGDVLVGEVIGRSRVRTGSGDITLDAATGPADLKAGSGNLVVGRLDGDLEARTSSGDVRVRDAVAGRCEVTSGSGDVTVAVHSGVVAEVDLSTGSGRARSDLAVNTLPAPGAAALHLRGRTGSGDVLVTRAVTAA